MSAEPPHAVLLDVGHGNAAVFVDGSSAIVVDAGSGGLVAETLAREGVEEIEALVISHRHHDHTSELPSLLADPKLPVRKLFMNSDSQRRPGSEFEEQLAGALNDSIKAHGTEYHQANSTLAPYMETQNLRVQVLAPDGPQALTTVGARRKSGGQVGAHTQAVVMRIGCEDGRTVLFGSDLERARFKALMEETDLHADVLVYPHHGGRSASGTDAAEERFAAELSSAVAPSTVVFSNGRDRHSNPRREIVRGVLRAPKVDGRKVRILCTQLAQACSSEPVPPGEHLDPALVSAGSTHGLSCSGSVRVELATGDHLLPEGQRHVAFVINTVGDTAMCVAERPTST